MNETSAPSVVELTPSAVREVRIMQANQPEHAGRPLRLFIEQGGCSGMQYGMTFDEVREGDAVAEFDGVRVVVDADSAGYLRGTVVDFSDALTGGGFKLRNPNARASCGCGKSFQA
jgi:iron-sulfur cluster assembly accessory protein